MGVGERRRKSCAQVLHVSGEQKFNRRLLMVSPRRRVFGLMRKNTRTDAELLLSPELIWRFSIGRRKECMPRELGCGQTQGWSPRGQQGANFI